MTALCNISLMAGPAGDRSSVPRRNSIAHPTSRPSLPQFNRVNSYFAQNYAALPTSTFAGSASCGQCVSVKCTDDSCSSLPAVTALVVDQCYSCSTCECAPLGCLCMEQAHGFHVRCCCAGWSLTTPPYPHLWSLQHPA